MIEPLQIRFEPTGDPDKVKVSFNRDLGAGRHVTVDDPAPEDQLASTVLSVPGIGEVYILGNFMTLTRIPDADWRTIGPILQVKLHEILK